MVNLDYQNINRNLYNAIRAFKKSDLKETDEKHDIQNGYKNGDSEQYCLPEFCILMLPHYFFR